MLMQVDVFVNNNGPFKLYAVPITLNHFTPRKPLNIVNAVTVK